MKLRIKGNSLRLRVTRSELTKFVNTGRIEETIHFASDPEARLTYILEHKSDAAYAILRYNFPEVAVVLPTEDANAWEESNQIGIYTTVDLGPRGSLDIIIEKDLACLDLNDADNLDTFPNPNAGAVC